MSNRVARLTVLTVCALAAFALMGGARPCAESAKPANATAPNATKQPAPALAQAPQPVTVELTSDAEPAADDSDAELLFSAPAVQAAAVIPAYKPAGVRRVRMEVTAYCPCKKCCGPKAIGLTASGKHVSHNGGRFVAADRKFRFGTKLQIPGYAGGKVVPVLDRGGAIKGDKLDVFFPTHAEAKKWGRQKLEVIVVE